MSNDKNSILESIRIINDIAFQSHSDPIGALKKLSDAGSSLDHEELIWIRAAVLEQAANHYRSFKMRNPKPEFTEFDLHRHFWGNLKLFIPGAYKVSGPKFDGENMPDGWIELNGEIIPVEIKRDFFNSKAERQLTRYMNSYSCNRGVAVAPKFNCETRENIIRVVARHLRTERQILEAAIQPSLLN